MALQMSDVLLMNCSSDTIVSTEGHNQVAVTTASELEIELWLSVLALILLQVHCNPPTKAVQL